MRILVVEDEAKVARALKEGLEGEGYQVATARTGEDGFFLASSQTFDLVVLDLMLPRTDGLEVLNTLRRRGHETPVLILTARDSIDDRVLGLDSGADDYLVKPFAFAELLARIRALLRRGRPDQVLRLKAGDLDMDIVTRRVTRGGQELELTAREFELLESLLRNKGRLVSREMLARRALRPVDEMASQARSITAERLAQRLPVSSPHDELGRLALVFNETFSRLERSFDQLRCFTADASHELRTPLTAIRSVGEVGLREERGAKAYREVIGSMLEEADRLTRLVDSLLALARADAGHVTLAREEVDLGEMAREAVGYLGPLAEEKHQSLTVEADASVPAVVDRLVLRQALVNLVDNAIKYSAAATSIRVRAMRTASGSALEVADAGPGIAPEHQERVFDRFYRVDKARSRDLGGAGLGLSLARWAVEAHGGRIELESEVGKGSTFRIVLPTHGGEAT